MYNVLSIEAWREAEGGWNWNAWYKVGTAPQGILDWSTRKVLKWFRDNDYTPQASCGKLAIEDDGYNLVVALRHTKEPLFAIEYGAVVEN